VKLFVTVGNALQPFDRMLRAVDEALEARPDAFEGCCQCGTSGVRPRRLDCVSMLARPAFEAEVMRADVVISHAGVGSVHTARRAGHVPVVFARREHLGEHVNDHQVELVEAFASQSQAVVAVDAASLLVHLDAFLRGDLRRRAPAETQGGGPLALFDDVLRERSAPPPSRFGRLGASLLASLGPTLEQLRYKSSRRQGAV
jgi:UDP-N-acetylglucosamine transferase subunit ALG13